MSLPDDYLKVLAALAQAFSLYEERTRVAPVLVGGAATALSTAGAFMSVDFDVIANDDEAFGEAMAVAGFTRAGGVGHLAGGFYHADHPDYVVEQVSGSLFDGRSDPKRMVRIAVEDGTVVIPSIEDLIADRLGQHAIASKADDSRLLQARALYTMAVGLDRDYLVRRIVEEQGDPAEIGL